MVADREVLPVGGERVAVRAEDPSDVGGVVLARVEVDVVRDLVRQMERHRLDGMQQWLDVRTVCRDRHPCGQRPPDVPPGGAAGRQQRGQVRLGEELRVGRAERVCRGSGVQHMVADADTHPALRGVAGRGEHAVGKVVRTEGIALGQIERAALLGHVVLPRFPGRLGDTLRRCGHRAAVPQLRRIPGKFRRTPTSDGVRWWFSPPCGGSASPRCGGRRSRRRPCTPSRRR